MAFIDEYLVNDWYGEANRLASVAITVPDNLGPTMLLALATGRSTSTNPCGINSFTWEGDTFSAIGGHDSYDLNGEGEVYSYYLLNPSIATGDVTIGYDHISRNHSSLVSIVLLKKVALVAPVGEKFATGSGTSHATADITTKLNNLMFHHGGLYSTIGTAVPGSGQTLGLQEYSAEDPQPSSLVWSTKQAGSALESMSTAWDTSRDNGFIAFSVEVLLANQTQVITAL